MKLKVNFLGAIQNREFEFDLTKSPVFIDTKCNTTLYDAMYYLTTGILKNRYSSIDVSTDIDIKDAFYINKGVLNKSVFTSTIVGIEELGSVYNSLLLLNREISILSNKDTQYNTRDIRSQIDSQYVLLERYYNKHRHILLKESKSKVNIHILKSQIRGINLGICPLCNQVIPEKIKDYLNTKAEYNLQCLVENLEITQPKISNYVILVTNVYAILGELYKQLGTYEYQNTLSTPKDYYNNSLLKKITLEEEFIVKANEYFKQVFDNASKAIKQLLGMDLVFKIVRPTGISIFLTEEVNYFSTEEYGIIDLVLTLLINKNQLTIIDYNLSSKTLKSIFDILNLPGKYIIFI